MRLVSYIRTTSFYPEPSSLSPEEVLRMQREEIASYVLSHGWTLQKEYCDFSELLEDGIHRRFDMVIVASVFYAGSSLRDAREVLLRTFHYGGIPFLAIKEEYDSTGKSNEAAEDFFRQQYAALRKISFGTMVKERCRQGILSWSDRKYGYRLTEDGKLVPDEETAPVVKRIFTAYRNGDTVQEIAGRLSAEGIPSPLSRRGGRKKEHATYAWSAQSVRRLLDKTVYVGYWTKTVKGECISITNPPILSQELFSEVQSLLQKKSGILPALPADQPSAGQERSSRHTLSGLVFHEDTGLPLRFRISKTGEGYFSIPTGKRGKSQKIQIFVSDLEKIMEKALENEKKKALLLKEKTEKEGAIFREKYLLDYQKSYQEHAFALAEKEAEWLENQTDPERKCSNLNIQKERILSRQQEEDFQKNEQRNAFLLTEESFFSERKNHLQRIETLFSTENPWLSLYLTLEPQQLSLVGEWKKYIHRITATSDASIHLELKETFWYQHYPESWKEAAEKALLQSSHGFPEEGGKK